MINTIKALFLLVEDWAERIRLQAARSVYKRSIYHDRKSVMHWPFPWRRYHKAMSYLLARIGNILY